MPNMEPRTSQRRPLACRECTKRKRKCDKKIPCSRCIRLGLTCAREVVYLTRNLNRNDAEINFLESLKEGLRTKDGTFNAEAIERIANRLEHLRSGDDSQEVSDRGDEAFHHPTSLPTSMDISDDVQTHDDKIDQGPLTVTALEHMAWGRGHGDCFPHRRCACHLRQQYSESFVLDPSESFLSLIAKLPDMSTAEVLVSFHINHILWHHNSLHGPTFLQQCKTYWETGEYVHPQWLALYCAVLSTSLFCLQNSWKYQDSYQLMGESNYSPQLLFQAMVDFLQETNFLQYISIYSVQAVVISTELAHNIGQSLLNATLFSAAIRIAECLGLHKITDDGPDPQSSPEAWQEEVEKETGRSLWMQMIVQDHFAMAFTDTYGIHPSRYSTSAPKNIDEGLIEAPEDVPTIATYNRVLGRIAYLMPELMEGMGTLKRPKPTHEQYSHVLQMDMKMRRTVRAFPDFLLRQDDWLETQHPWLTVARQSLAITAAEKIIMIHRPFIFRSFESRTYIHTRRTCVAAAITILREYTSIAETGELSLWTHVAFCITAALILSLEVILDQADSKKEIHDVYIEAVGSARQKLSQRINDILAHRGVVLLDAIFSEAGCAQPISETAETPRLKTVSLEDIVNRFTSDLGVLGLTTQARPFDIGLGSESGQPAPTSSIEDFTDWFERTFN